MSRLHSPGFKMALAPPVLFLCSHSTYEPWDMAPVRRDAGGIEVISMDHGRTEGPHMLPEPTPATRHTLLGLKPDRKLRWKPPDMETLERHSINAVRLRNNGMSSHYSPGSGTALTPFAPFVYLSPLNGLLDMATASSRRYNKRIGIVSTRSREVESSCSPVPLPTHPHTLSFFEQDKWLRWKPFDTGEIGQRAFNIIKSVIKGTSTENSPNARTALAPFDPELATQLRTLPRPSARCTPKRGYRTLCCRLIHGGPRLGTQLAHGAKGIKPCAHLILLQPPHYVNSSLSLCRAASRTIPQLCSLVYKL
jgi:hypothetical protein